MRSVSYFILAAPKMTLWMKGRCSKPFRLAQIIVAVRNQVEQAARWKHRNCLLLNDQADNIFAEMF